MGFREDGVRAYQDGQTAAREGRLPTDCPHPRDSALRLAWVRGYVAAISLTEESAKYP
ncbi:Rmf/CrpP fold protein [Streptomyces sp. NPDC050844]|uniref:Rmf/CrpP fold protein n=1 Tax=Streptomyces sp. NPDC050844 TaxID=3155790 RepID=UPI0033C88B37